jgi:hypothetical protein
MKGVARTPSCFAVADRLPSPNAVELRAWPWLPAPTRSPCSDLTSGRCLPTGRATYLDSTKGAPLDGSCTWPTTAGIPWFDKTWKLNELERPERSRELARLD